MGLLKAAKRSYKFLFEKSKLFWLVNILKVILMICSLVPAFLLSVIMANMKTSDLNDISILILVLAIAYAVNNALEFVIFRLKQNVEKNARANLKKVFMRKLFEHQNMKADTAKLTEILYNDVNNVINILFNTFDIILNLIFSICLAGILFYIKWTFALLVLLIVAISSLVTYLMRKKIKNKELEVRKGTDYHFKLIRDIVKNIRQIKITNSEDANFALYEANIDDVKKMGIKKERMIWFVGFFTSLLSCLLLVLLLWEGTKYISMGVLSAAEVIVFISFASKFNSSCNGVIKNIINQQQVIVSVERALPVLEYHVGLKKEHFPKFVQKVTAKDLCFAYINGQNILENFNITLKRGGTLIIGCNGSGKTTLLNLLSGVIIPDSGTIFLDGVALDEIPYQEIQRGITFYSQDDILFEQTIKSNILSFKDSELITDIDVYDICERLNILQDIKALKNGFETLLSESRSLSFGQKKKILFARAFLKPSQMLILDEPLVGLDEISQKQVIEILKEVSQKKILIIATHKPDLFDFCDQKIEL